MRWRWVSFLLSQGAGTIIETGDGKTPLELAEECNHVEIIDVLKSCTTQIEWPHSETDRLPSHTSQPVAAKPNEVSIFHSNSHSAVTGKPAPSTVLLPFSDNLRVDKELNWSNEYFRKSIEKLHESKELSAIDQLKAKPNYPTPHVLAQIAKKAYADNQLAEPTPPAGWQLLTTVSKSSAFLYKPEC